MGIAPQFQKYISSDYKHLDPDSSVVEIPEPPLDNSHATRMELEELERVIQEAKLPREIMRVADKDPLRLFYSVAKKNGLDPLEQEAEEWADDWTKLSFEYKLKFKRRRPWEVKKEHDIDFVVNKSDTTESPSYPSGHAMMGYGVAEFYKDKYPLMAEEWDNIADIIAHSRLQMGVHYPSDVEASKKIVEQLAEQVKEASYARQLLRTGTGRLTTRAPTGPVRKLVRRAPPTGRAPTPTPTPTPTTTPTWGQRASSMGSSIGNWATNNPTHATAAVVGTGAAGAFGANKLMQPKPANQMPKFGSLGHLEQRRSERAKFMSKEDLASLEKQVRSAKDLPDGSHYITLPHGRKGVVRTEDGKSHLATILDARMRPPGRDLTRLLSGLNKEANLLSQVGRMIQQGIKQEAGYLAETGRQVAKGVGNIAQSGANAARSGAKGVRHGYEKVITHPKAIPFSLGVQSIVTPNTADDIGNILKLGRYKTAAEKLRLYHGSPHDLETLEPRQPNRGAWGEQGLYGTPNPLVAALYAIARNDSKGSWGVLPDGRLIAKGKKELNPEGYVYEYDSDDYIPPPEDDPGIGYASQSSPTILSKKRVYLDELRDSITRVDDKDKFLEYFKKTSSPRLRTTIFGVDQGGNLLHGFGNQGFYKFPGGGVDAGESIIEAAKRELLEEAGYEVDSIEELPGLDTSDSVGATSAKGHMGHGSSLTKYLLARLGKRNESLLGSEGDAIGNLQTAPIDEVLGGLEGDMLFGSGVAASNHAALSRVRDMLQKTSSDQPLLRHRATLLIRDPETGKLLAAKEPPNSNASPFYFPGGGLYDDEYDTPRNPSDEDIIEGARREALEELGIELDNPRVVGSHAQELEDWWKAKTLKNRGVPYVGGHEHYVLADKGKENRSLYNVEGDAFDQGDYYDPEEIVEALSRAAKSDSTFAPFNREQLRAIKDNLLTKTSSIDLLTGRMGAGKSTLLNKIRDQYDIVEGTDLGSVVDGKFVEPSDEDKPRLRQEKADRLLAAHKAGKRVLMEGYPPGLFRIPGMVEAADRAVILEPDLLQRLMQIGNRSKERGTSVEEDIRFAVSPEHSAKEQKYLDMLRESIAGTHIAPTSEDAEEYLLKKNASDLSVLTAVPKQNLDLIMRKGLASQKAISEDPELTKAFLDQRGIKEEDWRKELSDALKGFKPDSRLGPSVFFSEPDPDKVSDPRHFINQFDTTKLRVNLGKLLKDIPETRFHGVELEPFNEEAWEADPDNYPSRRHRDLTTDEIAALTAKDPKELWKHYKDEYIGKLYAGDVPHGMIITPSGIIPPEYLEQVEKTSSAKEQLRHILVTGHSGAGKSTYARQLAEELGMPLHELDPRAKEILSQDYPDHEGLGWPGDISERVVREALALDTPHVIEGTQIHDVPYLGADLRRILVDTPEDRVIEQRAAREYEKRKLKNKSYRPMEGHRDAARKLVDYYRDSIDNFRGLPGVESIVPEVKQASLEDEFQPDLTPEDLRSLGVYDQVYGDAPSEASMKEWPAHWLNPQDPLGWLQWYDRYSGGRRTDDDDRQIKRWKSFKARHLAQYLNKPTPRRAAALRNWGIDVGKY